MASLKPRHVNGKFALDQLTKELFLKNVIEARKAQGESIENVNFNKSRCRVLSTNEEIKNSNGIVYWMSRECRVYDNWAFLFAQRLALKHKCPLYVCFICKDAHHLYPTKRHFTFLLEGLKLVKERCSELNIHFYLLNSTPKDLAKLCIKNDIGGIVCDFNPLRYIVKVQKILVDTLSGNIPVVQVDAHNIVPVWEASDKQEGMAKFIRPKITKKLPEYLTGFPEVCKHPYSDKFEVGDEEFENIDDAYGIYEPKWEVPPVKWGEGPGEKGGLEALRLFMVKNLSFYGVNSNDPSKDTTSQISPWLHFGHISAQRCALEVKSLETLYKEQCEKFLEELIIRKELSDNYCFYNENYDNTNGAANWAKETLKVHSKDKRIWVYSREQLEKAETHDEMWNAAQLQAVQDGKIHGYMRMYWCKKILEWTESPETAIAFSIWLNDTFCLDGTDPNGYVGIMWSICGVHDQGWKEREIFGKIRYMVDYSLRRKFDMDAYCSRFGRKISAETKKKTDKSGSSENKKKLAINKKGVKRKAI